MKVYQENFDEGAQSVSLELCQSELIEFIAALEKLASGQIDHLHFRSDFSAPGIGDIEISCSGDVEPSGLTLEA